MSHQIYITVENKEIAEAFVEDVKGTDSISYIDIDGNDCEIAVLDIHYNETIGDVTED